jgi:hypothetical protein
MTLTLNQANWTGKEITVEVEGDTFEYGGCYFRLVTINHEGETFYNLVGDQWTDPLIKGYTYKGYVYMSSCGVEREAKIEDGDEKKAALIAAIQVLSNTL